MRILIVHDYGALVGGAEHMAVTLRDGLRERGHDARLFASSAEPVAAPNPADYVCFGTMSPLRKVLQVANPSAALRLRRTLDSFRPDLVHLRMFMTQLSPLVLRELYSTPTLLHVLNYDLICPLNTKVLPDGSTCRHRSGTVCFREGCLGPLGLARALSQTRLRERWYQACDLVVANSEWVRQRLLADGIDVADVVLNGVPERPPRPTLADPPTIAFAGRLVPKKGADVLVRAVARIVRELPDVRLVVAGDGPERPKLERLVRDLGLREHVSLLGYLAHDDLEPALGKAWVHAVPSLWEEPFGLTAAEAMMRGTAVVATAARRRRGGRAGRRDRPDRSAGRRRSARACADDGALRSDARGGARRCRTAPRTRAADRDLDARPLRRALRTADGRA